MPLKKEEKILFLHIPKTGGTSIESFFKMDEEENFCFYSWGDSPGREPFLEECRKRSGSAKLLYEPQHYTIEVIKKVVADYDSYFKFAFVRNPYTRILSEYFYVNHLHLNDYAEFNPEAFHTWCAGYLATIDSSHKEPQVNYMDENVNFIGKYENFTEDFELLKLKLIDFSPEMVKYKDMAIPWLNTTGLDKSKLITCILPETQALIHSVYAHDFKRFSYSTELSQDNR